MFPENTTRIDKITCDYCQSTGCPIRFLDKKRVAEILAVYCDAAIRSEAQRRNQAKRKVKSGGRNGGPTKLADRKPSPSSVLNSAPPKIIMDAPFSLELSGNIKLADRKPKGEGK